MFKDGRLPEKEQLKMDKTSREVNLVIAAGIVLYRLFMPRCRCDINEKFPILSGSTTIHTQKNYQIVLAD